MVVIDIPYQYNDSFISTVLDRTIYILRFTYNTVFDYWTLGVYTQDREPICNGIKIVPNYPMNHYIKKDGMPNGIFTAVKDRGEIGEDGLSKEEIAEGEVHIYYIPFDELPAEVQIYEE